MSDAGSMIELIGVESGLGALDTRCEAGPGALRDAGLSARLREAGMESHWQFFQPEPFSGVPESPTAVIAELCQRLSRHVEIIVRSKQRFAVIGGDHSCAVGTWSGVNNALTGAALGLLWIDAHMDSHTPRTTPSGAVHGMPLAALLGEGDALLTHLAGPAPKLKPEHVCIFGVRSFEPEEQVLLASKAVKVITMDRIHQQGLDEAFNDALAWVRRETGGYGISIDLDAVDPQDAPGVGSPVPGGLEAGALCRVLQACRHHTDLVGMEIVEFNPDRDVGGRTATVVGDLLIAAMGRR